MAAKACLQLHMLTLTGSTASPEAGRLKGTLRNIWEITHLRAARLLSHASCTPYVIWSTDKTQATELFGKFPGAEVRHFNTDQCQGAGSPTPARKAGLLHIARAGKAAACGTAPRGVVRAPSQRHAQWPRQILEDSSRRDSVLDMSQGPTCGHHKQQTSNALTEAWDKATSYGLHGEGRRKGTAWSLMESYFLGTVPEDLRYGRQLGIQQSQLSDC